MYWITGGLGFFLMAAPNLLGYTDNSTAYWTSLIIGGVVAITSVLEGIKTKKENWEYWVAIIAGVVSIIAPFIFGYNWLLAAMWTSVIVGTLLAFFSGAKLYKVRF